MHHFLDINQLSRVELESLIDKALSFKSGSHVETNKQAICATLFYENSTRTRLSFEIAAKRLGMMTVDLDINTSSVNKGETLVDTVQTLMAMEVSHVVIRHQQEKLILELAETIGQEVRLINAGDGQRAHPSQALLDLTTIYQYKQKFHGLKVAILGDIKHSRVANSLQNALALVGVSDCYLVAPPSLQATTNRIGIATTDIVEGVSDADVIICLRVQKERFESDEALDFDAYREGYTLTEQRLKLAKPDAIIMHPGPVNRDIEIDSDLVDCSQSVILEQVTNGVFARMAILSGLN